MTSEDQDMPERIDKYQIKKVLGKGAMGVVYMGLDAQIERMVAVKVMHPHLIDSEQGAEFAERFKTEAKAAARCLHPNIVSVFDFGFHQGRPYIAMEYVEGRELKAHRRRIVQYSLASAIDITTQVLRALEHAHSKNVVHRDIKPANIIILKDGGVKVSDFGVARLDTSDQTSVGCMIGTPRYMSPEGLLGNRVDHRADLYSVGVMFYELLTQRHPDRTLRLEQIIASLQLQEAVSEQTLAAVKQIIQRALEPSLEARMPSATEFIRQLSGIDAAEPSEALTSISISAYADCHDDNTIPDGQPITWGKDVLGSLEQALAKYVGPMAHYLVMKTSSSSNSMEDLSQILAQHIPTEKERLDFIHDLTNSGIYRSNSSNPGTSGTSGISGASVVGSSTSGSKAATVLIAEEDIQRVSDILVFYVGPLASRMARKYARQASSLDDFYQRLAANIPNSKERQEFINKTKKR